MAWPVKATMQILSYKTFGRCFNYPFLSKRSGYPSIKQIITKYMYSIKQYIHKTYDGLHCVASAYTDGFDAKL